jgi:tRNA A-37 threonylcarbamoyl transferase component Bud32
VTAATCPDDDALLALATGDDSDEVVSAHTERCESCRGRLESLRVGLATLRIAFTQQGTLTHQDPVSTPDQPAQIGKYFIVGTLGEGAQAVVYRGVHATLNKEVVLKVGRHPIEGGALDRAHLVNEGKVLALLDHPHLARVLDLDFHEGRPFLVIEYVEGVNLEEYAATTKPSPRQSAALVAKLAHALAVAHHEGVVHHDIKPSNILIDEMGRPLLIDFGLAWLRRAEGRKLEETPAPGGTLAYMAPEHARGEVEKIGPASDVFALGGVLYFLLTGKPPFTGPDAFTVQQKAMRCDYDAGALDRPGVPARLAALCRQALSANAGDRPTSAEVFAAELEKAAVPPKKRRWAIVAGVAAAGVLGVAALTAFLARSPGRLPPAPGAQRLVRLYERMKDGAPVPYRKPILPPNVQNGDRVAVVFEVPRDSEAVLFWVGSSGTVHEFAPAPDSEGKTGPRLRYPAEDLMEVSGPKGTELFLVIANRKGRPLPTREEMEGILTEVGGSAALPAPRPDDPQLLLHRDRVEEEDDDSRDPGVQVSTPLTQTRRRLEELRKVLRKKYDWFWGVAIPHV